MNKSCNLTERLQLFFFNYTFFSLSSFAQLSKQVLIITRDDTTAIVSAYEKTIANPDNCINTLFLYLKCIKIPSGFYSVNLKKFNKKYSAYLVNKKKVIISELKINVDFDWRGDDLGVIGGISENEILFSFINETAPKQKAIFKIVISD